MTRPANPSLDIVVVVPSFNQRELLAQCLSSVETDLAASGLRGRIVVVDNASWDDSCAMVRERFARVTLIENELNTGFSAACNLGGRQHPSRYLLLLNNDAVLLPGSLAAMVRFCDEHPAAGALTGRLLSPAGRERYPARHVWQRWWPPRPRIHELSWVPGTCMLLRREALDAVGWLDEDFFFYNEDLDLSKRLVKGGWKLFYHPEVGVIHHESGSSRLIRPRAMLEGYRGTLLLAHKHYGRPAYHLTRFGCRVEVRARLALLRLQRQVAPRDPAVAGRLQAYEAIRQVLRQGVTPGVRGSVKARSEG